MYSGNKSLLNLTATLSFAQYKKMILRCISRQKFKTFRPIFKSFYHWGSLLQIPNHLFSSSLKKYSHISEFLSNTSTISSRNQIIEQLSDFLIPYFKQNEYKTLANCLKILTCRIEPPMKGVELNLADNTLIHALAKTFNLKEDEILEAYSKEGDLAKVAEKYFVPSNKGNDITIDELVDLLNEIVLTSGKGSKEKKEEILCEIFSKFKIASEMFFFIRFMQKGFRIGMSQKSVVAAIEKISKIEEINEEIKKIENDVFGCSLGIGQTNDNQRNLTLGTPINCMLSRPANNPKEVPKLLKKYCDKVIAEAKYDGERAQIHYNNSQINIFSRGLENQNQKFRFWLDEMKDYFKENNINSCILDAEIVAYDYENKKILSFSDISSFARKSVEEIQELPPETNIAVYIFDILLFETKALLQQPLENRKNILQTHFKPHQIMNLAEGKLFDLEDPHFVENLDQYFDDMTKKNLEGLIIKALGPKTFYDTKGRTQWVKLKKNIHGKSLADTLDLIPIAGYWGKGKRSSNFGAYLVASFNKISGKYEAICKLGTGFTDESLVQLTESLKQFQVMEKPKNYYVAKTLKPDVWFLPAQVWEIECDKLTLSPLYQVGKNIVDSDKGLSLRFPRFIRSRTDKKVDQATETQEIIDMYQRSGDSQKIEEDDNNSEEK